MSWKRSATQVSQLLNCWFTDQHREAIRIACFFFALVLRLWLVLGVSRAQSFTATVRGTVRDESGAVVPGASIMIQNTNKGWTRTTTTDSLGDYVITQLPADTYSITAQLTGFKTEIREGIVLQVGQEARIDFTLTVGQLEERVVVTAGAPLVQSENAMVGNVIDELKIKEMPLNGREFWQLARLAPQVRLSASMVPYLARKGSRKASLAGWSGGLRSTPRAR